MAEETNKNICLFQVFSNLAGKPSGIPIESKSKSESKDVTICGDFNVLRKMWDDGSLNTNGQHFISFVDKYDYTILNITEPTYFSS